jgi:hypothetical protein
MGLLLRHRWVQSAGELPVTWQSILVVARARNHLQANHGFVDFQFDIRV